MAPRLPRAVTSTATYLLANPSAAGRAAPASLRLYSAAQAEPLIRVANVPAGSNASGHIRVLELNRAAARNAISKGLLAALRAEVDAIHAQYGPAGEEYPAATSAQGGPTRALVIASAVDSCFCAGADLKERRGFTQEEYGDPPIFPSSL